MSNAKRASHLHMRKTPALGHGHWLAMFQNKEVPFGDVTAKMLMIVARDERLTNRKQANDLPPSWYTLYELTKLDDAT